MPYNDVSSYIDMYTQFWVICIIFIANEYGLFKPDEDSPQWLNVGRTIKDYGLCDGVSGRKRETNYYRDCNIITGYTAVQEEGRSLCCGLARRNYVENQVE